MRSINVPCVDGIHRELIYEIHELHTLDKLMSCKESKKRGITYLEIPCAFDIETSNVTEPEHHQLEDTEIYDNLRGMRLKYSDRIKHDIPDFETDIRKHFFGTLYLSKRSGTPIDVAYQQLSTQYPFEFPSDIINVTDQLLKIIEVINNNKPKHEDFRPFAFMYHWQFCLGDEVVFGRTWNEFRTLMKMLEKRMNLSEKNRLVVWCHNLPFEFQFMRKFINVIDSFCRAKYSPLKIVTDHGIEFRCSLALSNMSLEKFCENESAIHYKLDGETFDYKRLRTPKTVMSESELAYCYNDVRGLCECIENRMKEHTLAQMPMTSTGYVRSDIKKALRKNKVNRERFKSTVMDVDQYQAMRSAFRGGDTHANARWSNQILHDLKSYDKQSSYPAQMMCEKFPASAWLKIKKSTYLNRDLTNQHILLHVFMKGVRFKAQHGMPYLAYSKLEYCATDRTRGLPILDNGRIIYTEGVIFWCTEIDLEIIKQDYEYTDIDFKEIYVANSAPLSAEYRGVIKDYFVTKSKLKGIESEVYEYNKSKNKLNGIYGDTVMKIDQTDVRYINSEYVETKQELKDQLEKYYKSRSSYRIYQTGVYVTAYARKALHDALIITGRDTVYQDTDSNKHLGDHADGFKQLNDELLKKAMDHGAYCEIKGKVYTMGLWEDEHPEGIAEFKTLGAKKYVYRVKGSDKYKCTIAGVNKKRGSEHFTKHGIDAFRDGEVIQEAGHLVAYRNDDYIHKIIVDHVEIETASNVALIDDRYTIGKSSDFSAMMESIAHNRLDYYFA